MNHGTLLIALLAATALAQTPADKPTPAREQPPAGGEPRPFRVPPRVQSKLPNGLQISTVSYGRIPKATVRAVINAGNVNEGENEVWLADLTGEMLKEGSPSKNGAQVAAAAAAMGGSFNVAVGADQTTVSLEVLSEFAADAVKLVGEVLTNPAFPESELPRLRNDMLRRLVVSKSQPQSIADELFFQALYPDHPYGRTYPTEAAVKGYTLEQVRSFYNRLYGAQRTHVYVAGMFDREAVTKAADAAFRSWKRGEAWSPNPPKSTTKPQLLSADRPGAPQSTLRIGLRFPHAATRDYIPSVVTNALLGGAFSARITSNIREDKGYTYSPYSYLANRARESAWIHNSDVTTASTGPALQEIVKEIERLRREAAPNPELKGIEEGVAGTFVLQNSNPNGIIGRLSFVDLHGLSDSWLNNYVQQVFAVSSADVQRIAETYLDPKKMTIVVVGDQAKIKEQIEPFRKRGVE